MVGMAGIVERWRGFKERGVDGGWVVGYLISKISWLWSWGELTLTFTLCLVGGLINIFILNIKYNNIFEEGVQLSDVFTTAHT